MPNIIDDYISKMSFDNSNFEKNVAISMKSLDKLKDKLDFSGVKTGLEKVAANIKNLTFDKTTKSLETVISKFNTLDVVAYSAINRIVSTATDAGIRIAKSLSIDQVTSGWAKYAQETSAVQTIMSSTGESMETVNAILEKLSWFSDETSYSFNDMVGNIAKFTSNGVKLEVAQSAMQGIALAAALAGQNSQSAAHAMYNFAQSLGNGYVQLMDWKSINTANIDTVEFKNTIIETAKALGTLTKEGKDAEGVVVTTANFAQTLNQKWLTSDVLIKSLNKYGDFATQLQKLTEATDTTATEWMTYIRQYQKGSLDFAKAADNIGMTEKAFRENIKQLTSDDLGLRAFMAGQQTKTWEELVDATKDAASSKWSKIFKLIFGDYDEAREFYSDLVEKFYNTFVEPLNGLVDIMASWKKAGGRNSFINTLYTLYDAIELFNSSIVEHAVQNISAFEESIDGLDQGQRLAKITKNIETFVTSLYTKKNVYGKTIVEEAGKAIGEGVNIIVVSLMYGVKIISKIGKVFKTTIENAFPFKDFSVNAYRLFLSDLYEFAERLEAAYKNFELSEDETKSLENSFKGVIVIFKFLSDVFGEFSFRIFDVANYARAGIDLLLEGVGYLGSVLYEFDKQESLFSRLSKTFKSIFDYFNTETIYGTTRFQEIVKFLSNTFSLVYDILRFFPKVISGLVGPIKEAWKSVFPDSMTQEAYKVFLSDFYELGERIKYAVDNFSITEKETEGIKNIFKGIFTIIKIFISATSALVSYIPDILSVGRSILDIIIEVVGKVNAALFNLENSIHLSESFSNIFESIKNTIESAKKYFGLEGKNLFQIIFSIINPVYIYIGTVSYLIYKLTTKIIKLFAKPKALKEIANSYISPIKDVVSQLGSLLKAIEQNIKADSALKLALALGILSAAMLIISRMNVKQIATSMASLTAMLGELLASLKSIVGGKASEVLKTIPVLLALSVSMVLLTAPLLLLGKMNWEEMARGVVGIIGIAGSLILAIKLFSMVKGKIKVFLQVIPLLMSLAIAIDLLAIPIFALGMMDFDKLSNGLSALLIMIGSVIGTMALANKIRNRSIGKFVDFARSIFIFANALLILAIPVRMIGSMGWSNTFAGLTAITYLIALMFGVTELLNKMAFNNEKVKSMKKVAKLFTTIAIAVGIFAVSIRILAALSWNDILRSLTAITIVLAEFIGLLFIISKIPFKNILIMSKNIGSLFLSLSASIVLISMAIKKMGNMKEANLLQGLGGLLLVIGTLIGTLLWLCVVGQKMDKKSLVMTLTTLVITVGSIMALCSAIFMLQNFKFGSLMGTVLSLLILLGGMTAISYALTKLVSANKIGWMDILKSLLIVGVIGFAALSAVPVFQELTKYNFSQLLSVALGIAALFAGLTLVIAIIGGIAATGAGLLALVAGVATIIAIAEACRLLIPVIDSFKGLSIKEMASVALGLAAFFSILSLGSMVAAIGTIGIPAIIGMAYALKILAPVLQVLVGINPDEVSKIGGVIAKVLSLIALAGILGLVGGPGLAELGWGLMSVTSALFVGAVGFFLVSAGLSMFSTAITIILPLIPQLLVAILQLAVTAGQAMTLFTIEVVNGISKVAIAIGAGIITICMVIQKTYPVIFDTGINLIMYFLNGMTEKMPLVIQRFSDMIVAIFEALAIAMPEITAAGMDLIISLIEGIAEQLEKKSDRLSDAIGTFVGNLFKLLIESIHKAILSIADFLSDMIVDAIFGKETTEEEVEQATNEVAGAIKGTGQETEKTSGAIDKLKSKLGGLIGNMNEGAKSSSGLMSGIGGISDKVKDLTDNLGASDFTLTPVLDLDTMNSQLPDMQKMLDENGLSLDTSTTGLSTDSLDGGEYEVKLADMSSANLGDYGYNGSSSGHSGGNITNVNYTQNNYSPKALDRAAIYRDTQNNIALIGRVNKQNA